MLPSRKYIGKGSKVFFTYVDVHFEIKSMIVIVQMATTESRAKKVMYNLMVLFVMSKYRLMQPNTFQRTI